MQYKKALVLWRVQPDLPRIPKSATENANKRKRDCQTQGTTLDLYVLRVKGIPRLLVPPRVFSVSLTSYFMAAATPSSSIHHETTMTIKIYVFGQMPAHRKYTILCKIKRQADDSPEVMARASCRSLLQGSPRRFRRISLITGRSSFVDEQSCLCCYGQMDRIRGVHFRCHHSPR